MSVPFNEDEALGPTWDNSKPIGDLVTGLFSPAACLCSQDHSATVRHERVEDYLADELATPVVDDLYERLWFVARKASTNIDPLHRHAIKGRRVVPTEDTSLHLVWTEDRVFIKPIPQCLLSYGFWTEFLIDESVKTTTRETSAALAATRSVLNCRVTRGFVRSYSFLMRHQSDYALAKANNLLPQEYTWTQWARFLSRFRGLDDSVVAKRYHYGQMRLSRLNWAVRLFRPTASPTIWFYELPYWSTAGYIREAIGLLVFLFASASLVLSSMQVMLAVTAGQPMSSIVSQTGDRIVSHAFWGFSLFSILFIGLSWSLLVMVPVVVFGWQFWYGFSRRGSGLVLADA